MHSIQLRCGYCSNSSNLSMLCMFSSLFFSIFFFSLYFFLTFFKCRDIFFILVCSSLSIVLSLKIGAFIFIVLPVFLLLFLVCGSILFLILKVFCFLSLISICDYMSLSIFFLKYIALRLI